MTILFRAENEYGLLSKTIEKKDALQYFQQNVTGRHKDILGNTVLIKPADYHFLFKKHNPKHPDLLRYKARRMPWIAPTIKYTTRIREQISKGRMNYNYLAYVGVPNFILGISSYTPEYYCIITRIINCRAIFITAYPLQEKQFANMRDMLPPVS
jgi:hypothetical protein